MLTGRKLIRVLFGSCGTLLHAGKIEGGSKTRNLLLRASERRTIGGMPFPIIDCKTQASCWMKSKRPYDANPTIGDVRISNGQSAISGAYFGSEGKAITGIGNRRLSPQTELHRQELGALAGRERNATHCHSRKG